ncbi:Sialoadhesin [Merluccius polli]|uniref:B-cell receptor CD22 n=1 Tax=Merluccius polli TaxID=89951 RepID=A0AA47P1Q0_MERPO|nr:Sialoadhesin [Merluccius polli]
MFLSQLSGQQVSVVSSSTQQPPSLHVSCDHAFHQLNLCVLFILNEMCLFFTALQGNDDWTVTCTSSNVCSLRGSTVDISCTFKYPEKQHDLSTTVLETLWFTEEDRNQTPVDLLSDADYRGRVESSCGEISCIGSSCNRKCTLSIRDLRQSDSAVYNFRFKTNQPGGEHTANPGVALSVTDLQVKVSPQGKSANLECDSMCANATYIWYTNGKRVAQRRSYPVSINSISSYSCAVKGYERLHSPSVCIQGNRCYRVSYPTRTMCVLQGTSVNISCTYSHPPDDKLYSSTYWFKWRANQEPSDLLEVSEYERRAEYPVEETGRSTLRITDLRDTDSAEYCFTFETSKRKWKGSLQCTTLTVTGLRVEVTPVATVTAGQRVTLTCITSCPLADKPSYIWYQNNGPVTGSENPENQLVLDPVGPQHAGSYSCSVRNYPHLRSPEETLTVQCTMIILHHTSSLNLCVLFILNEMCLFFTALQGNDDWTVTYTSSNVCSLRGSTVDISCTFKYPEKQHDLSTTVLETLWFTKEDRNQTPVDLLSDADYTGRVESSCGEISCIGSSCNRKCTLSIRDLRQSDSAVYNFRFKTNQPGGEHTANPGVALTVTDLQVKVSPQGNNATLECDSMCANPTIIWYRNGQRVAQRRSYPVSINSINSYSCAVKGYERLHSPSVCLQGNSCNRVSYPTRTMCVLQGTSVNISCTYSHPPDEKPYYTSWFKWRANQKPRDLQSDSEYEGRVKYPVEETGRSTLRITDLRDTDSAEYRFTFETWYHEWKGSLHGTTLTVTGLSVEVTPVAMVTEGQRVTLTCITSCPLADKPSYIWYQNNGSVTGSENPENQLVLDPVGPQHAGNYSCSVRNYPHLRSPEETLTVQCTMSILHHTSSVSDWLNLPSLLNLCVLFILNEMCLFFTALQGNDDWTVTCTSSNVCSLRGSTVDISCTFKYPEKQHDLSTTVLETLWFTKEDRNQTPVDLLSDADYTGRVESSCGEISCIGSSCNRKCTLSIRDLRQSDSAVYNFRFKTNQPGGEHTANPGVALNVTDLQVKVSRQGNNANLECDSMCANPTIIWYRNGQRVAQRRSYPVSINSINSYSCAVKGYERLHSPSMSCIVIRYFLKYFSGIQGNSCYRVSYPTRTMCVLQGTSVDISCTYSHPPDAKLYYTSWFKWRANQEPRDLQLDSEYERRAEYPVEETGRSTLTITDLRDTDSAEYCFTFETSQHEWKGSLHGTTLTVTGLSVEVTPVATVTEGQRVTLTCITSCPLADKPSYIWYQNNGSVTGSENLENQLVLDPVGPQHAGSYSCSIRNYPHLRSPEETLTLNLCVLFILNEMCLFFTALQGNDDWTVTCTSSNVCSLRGSTVDISCTFKYPEKQHDLSTTVLETLWFTKEDRNQTPVDLLSDADYTGRVESSCGEISCIGSSCNRKCTLSIRDLRQSDSAVYNFRFKTNQPGGEHTANPGVALNVTDLQVKVSRQGNNANLECDSMCANPTIIWYRNGQRVAQRRSYPVSINSINSYSCAVKGYERLHSPSVCIQGNRCYRVSYPTRTMCVLQGTSVNISCTYSHPPDDKLYSSTYWFKWRANQEPSDLQSDSEYEGRAVYPVEETGRSTLRITDLRHTDSAEYRFTFETSKRKWNGSLHGTTLTVTGLSVEVTPVATVTEGQRVTLTCITSCPLADKPSYIWYQNNGSVTGSENPENQLVLDPVGPQHAGNYSCSVRNYPHLRSPEETLTVQCTMSILHHTSSVSDWLNLPSLLMTGWAVIHFHIWERPHVVKKTQTTNQIK